MEETYLSWIIISNTFFYHLRFADWNILVHYDAAMKYLFDMNDYGAWSLYFSDILYAKIRLQLNNQSIQTTLQNTPATFSIVQ